MIKMELSDSHNAASFKSLHINRGLCMFDRWHVHILSVLRMIYFSSEKKPQYIEGE